MAEDGVVRVIRTNNVDNVIQGVKDRSEMLTKASGKNVAGSRYLGSIDPVTGAIWAKECGAAIGTKEFAAYAKKKLQSNEFLKFRADIQ